MLASLLYGPVRKRNKDLVELVVFVRRHRRAVGQRCIVSWLMRSRVHSRGGDGPSRGALYAPRPSKICLVRHRGALRGTPGSACSQLGPNATKLPICAPVLASRRRRWWRGEEGARRCATSYCKSSATPCVTPFACPSFTCPSFTCPPRAAWGAACVCWAWIPLLENDASMR